MKEKLRIIYFDNNDYTPIKMLDVMDFGDRFVAQNSKDDYYGGIHLKKQYLHYTIATPEKEKALREYYDKRRELELLRIETQRKIFD